MPNYDLKTHSHGNVSSDGKIGTASGKIVTTGTGGALQASDSITKSMISDVSTVQVTITYTDESTETKNLVVYTPSS
ncbi:MAG: hypothetical protein IJL02_05270 [Methanobrevibacter sp.]|uniref:hypothetical protein n=1 Tax=Methanobrevibacter sp. TaxID=66852 RepID=UPI0025D76B5F|nr:hypothetical protein [Methanobrevibacter sp.]MBQ6099257.1 hypothetical protein [Methanobrevibacter sp.]